MTFWTLLPYLGASAMASGAFFLWRVGRSWRETEPTESVDVAEQTAVRSTLALYDAMTSIRFALAPLAARAKEGEVTWLRAERSALVMARRRLERSIADCERVVLGGGESGSNRTTRELLAPARRTADTLRRLIVVAEQPFGVPMLLDEDLQAALLLGAIEPREDRFHLDVLRQLRGSLTSDEERPLTQRV